LTIICAVASLRFIIVGAWPVALFLAIDLTALWLAFSINYRRARAHERIRLSDTILIVERISSKGHTESWSFEPYWVSLKLVNDDHYGNRLDLSLHQQKVSLGNFLSPDERTELYQNLTASLRQWKNGRPSIKD